VELPVSILSFRFQVDVGADPQPLFADSDSNKVGFPRTLVKLSVLAHRSSLRMVSLSVTRSNPHPLSLLG